MRWTFLKGPAFWCLSYLFIFHLVGGWTNPFEKNTQIGSIFPVSDFTILETNCRQSPALHTFIVFVKNQHNPCIPDVFAFLQFPRRQRHWPPPSPSPSFRPGQPTPLQTRSPSLGPPWTPETPVFQTGECGVEVDVLGVPWLVMISSKSKKDHDFSGVMKETNPNNAW